MIDETLFSYEEIKQALQEYIEAMGDSWKDYFSTSTGQILLELLAGFGSFVLYKVYTTRREAYLPTAKSLSSVTSIAEGLGYSVFRGIPPSITINILATKPVNIPAYTAIGTAGDYQVFLKEDLVLNAGDNVTVTGYTGYLKEETLTLTNPSQNIFLRFSEPVSEIFTFYYNNVKTDFSSNISELKDNFVLLTNYKLSLDLYKLDLNGTLQEGDTFTIKGIYFDYKTEEFDLSKISLFDSDMTAIAYYPSKPPDSVDKIKVLAPYTADTMLKVRAREDYKKFFLIKFPYLRDVASYDDTTNPGIVYLSYIKEDLTLLSDTEKQEFLDFVDQLRPFGIPLPQIVDPVQLTTTLSIQIKLSDTSITTAQVTNAIEDAIEKYSKFLGKDIDYYGIESYLEKNYLFIQIARIIPSTTYSTIDWNQYVKVDNYTISYI